MVLIGSSFGGWAVARFAELHPSRVHALVLLNPGFNLGERWEEIVLGGRASLAAWQRDGKRRFHMPATGEPVDMPWSFVRETRAQVGMPTSVAAPCCVLHGTRDDVVPHALSEAFVERQRERRVPSRLILLDDDHALTAPASLERIARESAKWCVIGAAPPGA